MTPRERVIAALNHREPDRIPVGICNCSGIGIHACTVYLLRQAFALDPPGTPVKVLEPFVMIGEIAPDLATALGADVVAVTANRNSFGLRNEGWRPWTFHDGTPLLVPEGFNTDPEPDGSTLMYPQGDRSVRPSGIMPKGGWYFDVLSRQLPIDDDALRVEDNLEEFGPISDEHLAHFARETERLYSHTDKAILIRIGDTAFGDIGRVPAPSLKDPKGIRDAEEWYMSHVTRRDYIYKVFERQCGIATQNLQRVFEAVGNRATVVHLTGTDFGGQEGPLFSPRVYRDLYKPFHKQVTDWVHTHTTWKTFIHSCGSVRELIPEFIEAGFDILNPVQCSAAGMDPVALKANFGDRIAFWGGGVNVQRTLPFGTPSEVRHEVRENLRVFGRGGGFVFAPVHNIQALVPEENLLALFETVRAEGRYPIV
ncbi:MAG: methyltransferase [candidate division NC10 bacterium RBG_16_65_8]|nr:MAG: methyltransferase [candidate division NC10 bacterium RBG_16_65_8]